MILPYWFQRQHKKIIREWEIMTNNGVPPHQGLLIILVDQSGSMMNQYCDGDSRTVFSAKVINRVINTIIKKNFNKDKPKNRCFISVIGYGYRS